MRNYTKIEAWQLADDLAVAIYTVTRGFPKDELYGLTSQVRRAAYSVPANIAEGASRQTKRDYLHFLYIARGSLSEAHYFIHLARRLDFLGAAEHEKFESQFRRAFGCLHGLIAAVERESGVLTKGADLVTSLIVVSLAKWAFPSTAQSVVG